MQDKKYTQEDLIKTKGKTFASILTTQSIVIVYNVLQVCFSLILVRLLEPRDFGLFAPIFAIFNFLDVSVMMGQGPLFIRKKDYASGHFMQVMAINAIIVISAIEFFSHFFSFINPQAPHMARILFLALLPAGLNSGIIYLATKRLERHSLFWAWMLDILGFGISAVFFALNKYGVYSFIYATILSRVLFFVYAFLRYKEEILSSSLIRLKQYFGYLKEGFVFNLSYITGALSDQADKVVLTKFISLGELGFYSIAVKYSNMFSNFIINSAEIMVYPLYSKFIDDNERTKKIYYFFTTMAFALLVPFNSFVFVFSKDILRIMAGEKWVSAAGLISVFSLLYLTKFVHYFGYQILWANKKEATNLTRLITRAVLFLAIGIILSFKYNIYGFVIAYFVQGFYDSVFYCFTLKGFGRQIFENMKFIVSIFLPVFISLNFVGKIGNFYTGMLVTALIYMLFLKFIFTPFIEREFNLKLKDFIAMLTKELFYKK